MPSSNLAAIGPLIISMQHRNTSLFFVLTPLSTLCFLRIVQLQYNLLLHARLLLSDI